MVRNNIAFSLCHAEFWKTRREKFLTIKALVFLLKRIFYCFGIILHIFYYKEFILKNNNLFLRDEKAVLGDFPPSERRKSKRIYPETFRTLET
jgi:hypothetical protein